MVCFTIVFVLAYFAFYVESHVYHEILKPSRRIINGHRVDISKVPYQTYIETIFGDINIEYFGICGANIISKQHVLTAAHCCVTGQEVASKVLVYFGANDFKENKEMRESTDVIVHPLFVGSKTDAANDIAVIRFDPVSFNDVIQPIALPCGSEIRDNFVGRVAYASGYGINSKNTTGDLKLVELVIDSNEECQKYYSTDIVYSHICTTKTVEGTCGGDSGGPLVVESRGRPILVGITSFGSRQCEDMVPSVFTRVTSFIKWIKFAMRKRPVKIEKNL